MRPIDIEIIDNFVSPSYLEELQYAVNPNTTQWFFQGKQSLKLRDNNIPNDIEDFGFVIPFVDIGQPNIFYDNKLSTFIRPLAYQIKDYAEALNIIRCRLDLTILHKQKYIHPPHVDVQNLESDFGSAIIYLNDTDGDTIIYDKKRDKNLSDHQSYPTNMKIKKTIAPKPGRLVLFNGDYVHTGHSPSEHQTRILLNIVLS